MSLQLPNPQALIAEGLRNPMSREWRQFIEALVKSMDAADTAIDARLDALETIEDWHIVGDAGEPAFQYGWENYDSTYNSCSFMKDPYGLVHIRGFIKNGSPVSGTIFTLPAAYRPLKNNAIASVSSAGVAVFSILASGNVYFSSGGSASWSCLDGISFWTG